MKVHARPSSSRSARYPVALSVLVVVLTFVSLPGYGWWDTQVMYQGEPPRIAHVEAEAAELSGGAVIVDDSVNYGSPVGGDKAVLIKPGAGTLTWKVRLTPSTYRLFAIGRVPEAKPWVSDAPEWPLFARVTVAGPDGKSIGDWVMQINYLNTYYDVARFSFPAHLDGEYTLSFSITDKSETPLLVDRLDLRDELGNTFHQGFKTARYLYTDAEIMRIRDTFRDGLFAVSGAKTEAEFKALVSDPAARKTLKATWAKATKWVYNPWGDGALDRVIAAVADGPVPVGQEAAPDAAMWAQGRKQFLEDWDPGYERWNTEWSGLSVIGAHQETYNHTHYLETGDPEIAVRLAGMLIGMADLYPALDWGTQNWKTGNGGTSTRGQRFTFTNGRFGKIQFSMWGVGFATRFAKTYDALFPFIQAHGDELALMVQDKLPSIRNGEDLIAFLDTRLLQYSGDCVNRNKIRAMQGASDKDLVFVTAVQGPNPAGNRMANWLYTRTYWDMTNDGGIQDQAIAGRNRDGSAIIGSVGYSEGAGGVLVTASTAMSRFVQAGGDPRFDLSDPNRYPAVLAGASFPLESRVAGGYQPLIGDWGRAHNPRIYKTIGTYGDFYRLAYRRTQDPRMAWLLKHAVGRTIEADAEWAQIEALAATQRDPQLAATSRNLEGFGLAILEAGSEHDDFTKKRALTLRHGAGKGHAHADSLSLEFYAHGTRALPDAGNRGGAPHPGDMRAHLGVTVDGGPMRNTPEINVSGTGWTTAFLPEPGSQVITAAARFGASPTVTRYERQVALIDVWGTDESYVFDVLRVAGGSEHVWSTHGPASEEADLPSYNFAVTAGAATPDAERLLAGHLEPTTGTIGAVAQAAWPMGRGAEARMMEDAFDAEAPAVTTRATLLGHAGETAYMGHSDPQAKGLEGSQWLTKVGFMHVRAAGDDGLQTVWPQIIESYRGAPLVTQVETLAVTPADSTASAPVAARLTLRTGQTDLVMADGAGDRTITAGDVEMRGQLAHISHDDRGLRLAHLVGGTELKHPDVTIEAAVAQVNSRITAVDYITRQITLDPALPAAVKPGQELLIGAPKHPQVFRIEAIDGAVVTLAHSAIQYQSEILSVDSAKRSVICSMSPSMLMADPHYYDGVTAVDERGQRTWKVATMKPAYIFMYIQEPVLDWPQIYTLADFPDSNGDGKRTATILNWGGGDGSPYIAEVEMQIAFFDEKRQVLFFELPENPDVVAANGWQWPGSRLMNPETGRWLVNEAGRRWIPNPAGKRNAIVLEGEVQDSDFTDADGDGRRVLQLYHFGVGDSATLTTDVVVRREDDGSYSISGSTAATATVTAKDGQSQKLINK